MTHKQMNKQQGFSLLEILIAFSILALSLGILLNIFASGVNTAMTAEDYTTAVQIAQNKMAAITIATPLQDESGVENDKYHWQVVVTPYEFNPEKMDLTEVSASLFKVTVTVSWDEDEHSEGRQLQLTTLKLFASTV